MAQKSTFFSRSRIKLFALFSLFALAWLLLVNLWSPTKKVRFHLDIHYDVSDPQFRATISSLLGPPLVPGNTITPLLNGDQIFPAMLEEIAKAKTSITLETFIYWSGTIGEKFTAALEDRARHGVKIDILLDWLGSRKFEEKLLERLKSAGVHLFFYHPVRWYDLDRLNNRTHRRLMVIDGIVGFIGGVGIADDWLGNGLQDGRWRDTHYKVTGPVVSQIQAGFSDNWIRTQEDVVEGERYFPTGHLSEQSNGVPGVFAQVFKSSADEGATSARLLFLYSIVAAKHSIDIENAYFLPDEQFIEELKKAVARGVRVRVLAPSGKTDTQIALKASHADWGELLKAGVQIWTYTPAMLHNKLMIIDSVWTSVGSANFDPRSFRLNKEANLNVWDREFAADQVRHFEDDLKVSKRIDQSNWDDRPWLERATDTLLLIVKPQL